MLPRYTTQVFLLVDIAYLLALPILLIFTVISRIKGHPPRKGLGERLGYGETLPEHDQRVLIHAVSVGEVNAIRRLVSDLSNQGFDIVVCVSTDTGIVRARELFGEDHAVTRYPIDFSFAVRRFLNRIKPTVFALVELEVWPNMIAFAKKMGIPVVVINGRLSERSFKRYQLVKPILSSTFARLTAIGMQNELYGERVRSLGGVDVRILGTMKWDNATIVDSLNGALELAKEMGVDQNKPLIVGGSTTPQEDQLLLDATPDGVQLLCAPRRPEWFDEAAKILAPCNRRTSEERFDTNSFLLDTIGELDQAFALADIVVIGRSFSPLHGSDPTQSIALGKPTIIGPNASDFDDIVTLLVEKGGLLQCDQIDLPRNIESLLEDQDARDALVLAGRSVIKSQQGATARYEELIMEIMQHG